MKKITIRDAAMLVHFPNMPFSPLLNEFIDLKFKCLPITVQYVPGQPYDTFAQMRDDVQERAVMKISMDFSDNTIFGHPVKNWRFRAVHDSFHIAHNKTFSEQHEKELNELVMRDLEAFGLPVFERTLLDIEMRGQVEFFEKHLRFTENQRLFTLDKLYEYGISEASASETVKFLNDLNGTNISSKY